MSLEKLRNEIDNVNLEIMKALKKRFEIGTYIALNKRKLGLAIKDEEREKLMMADLEKKAQSLGLDPTFINRLFRLIIDETIRVEEEQ